MTTVQQKQQQALAARQTKVHYATVLNSPEAKGKHALAFVLLDTDMSAEDIIATLAKAPSGEESPPTTQTEHTGPGLAGFNAPKVPHTFWDQDPLFQAGREFAMWANNKK
jgi:hypothetical protein